MTGVGPDGRSRVERKFELGGDGVHTLWSATDGLPTLGLPAGATDDLDLGVGPGGMRWMVARFLPNQESAFHWTRTVDFDTILAGSTELLLEASTVLLTPGDCVVMTGVRHAWRAGPQGCLQTATVIGVVD